MNGLAPEDRPREKLAELGAASLGDNELLAVLLGHGTNERNALDIANDVLTAAGGLQGLARASRHELARQRGVGPTTAARVLAGIELGRRTLSRAMPPRTRIGSPREAALYLLPRFGAAEVEQCGVLLMDTRHRVMHARVLTRGTVDASPLHPREVFREAAIAGAAALVLFHNHPSGDPSPSPEDLALTHRMMAAGELMGIEVVDHLVLTDTSYCSLRELCKLKGS